MDVKYYYKVVLLCINTKKNQLMLNLSVTSTVAYKKHLPTEHVFPSPVNPWLQEQLNEPSVLVQVANE